MDLLMKILIQILNFSQKLWEDCSCAALMDELPLLLSLEDKSTSYPWNIRNQSSDTTPYFRSSEPSEKTL
jgi:hypothetical protein